MSAGVRASSRTQRAVRSPSPLGGRASERGFTLIELMVVVIIIGVLAALAAPSMSLALKDRDTYNDAGAVMQLLRAARTHAIARGGATLVQMSSGTGDRGTFLTYEAVAARAGGAAGDLTPVATCKSPVDWTLANLTALDGVNMNGSLEANAGIQAQLFVYPSGAASTISICYTPLGRSYVVAGTWSNATNPFNDQLPSVNPVEVRVTRTGGATIRSVLVPPSGMARMFSHL